jgi:hypothetical protein
MHLTKIKGLSTISTRIASIIFYAAGATLSLQAQQSQVAASPAKLLDLRAELSAPLDLTVPTDLNYSSSVGVAETDTAERFNLSGREDQPSRRTYSRGPNYNDKTHNPDGSNKYAFKVGGGFTLPVGGTHNYYQTSWAFQAGAGRNFNKNFGVMLDFNWANFGIQTNTLNKQLALYNSLGASDQNGNPLTRLGGYGHVWSFSIDPVYNVIQGDSSGLYVTGGVGFYHKYTAFTTPTLGIYCSYYYGCYQSQANQSIDWYTSNAFGLNGGVGYTYKFSRFANERFFVEARYVYTANSRRPYYVGTGTSPASNNPNYFNAFPQGSTPTTYIPITFGIRF